MMANSSGDVHGNHFGPHTSVNTGTIYDNHPLPPSRPAACCITYDQNLKIVQRPDITRQLENVLAQDHRHAALWGFGGTGKTQLALDFAYRKHKRDGDDACAVFWVHAATETTFARDYQVIASKLDIEPNLKGRDLYRTVCNKIEEQRSWVLVIDNADDLTIFGQQPADGGERPLEANALNLTDFVPKGSNGTILWTSRDAHISEIATWASEDKSLYEIHGLSQEAIRFHLRMRKHLDGDTLTPMIAAFSMIEPKPYELTHLGAPREYQNYEEIFAFEAYLTLAATIELFESDESYHKPLSLFRILIVHVIVVSDNADACCTWDTSSKLAEIYFDLKRVDEAVSLAEAAYEVCHRLGDKKCDVTVKIMRRLGTMYFQQGRWAEAEDKTNQALAFAKDVLGKRHEDTLATMVLLGMILSRQGRHEEALTILTELLAISRQELGMTNLITLTCADDTAYVLIELDRGAEAQRLLHELDIITLACLAEENLGMLEIQRKLADVLFCLERFDEAVQLLQNCLSGEERILGPENERTKMTRKALEDFKNMREEFISGTDNEEEDHILLEQSDWILWI
ncbi:hypothetical protein F5X68DRAFT_236643 [Plectosphaerella plurivora]|uniref:ORC1/DEAH AAA+ ATPase domain-containing protein n=1 Tax=Plectosphaerella plurivora TaxID=936078 RepID=A0A9P8V249_9PEZI|nr:hypothetical protein F5X68DRAFT_236643 [Plectosphaerella plurivora]